MYSTRQIARRKEHSFWLFQNICKLPISNSFFLQLYHLLFKLSISGDIKFQKIKSDDAPLMIEFFIKVYLFKRASQLLLSI